MPGMCWLEKTSYCQKLGLIATLYFVGHMPGDFDVSLVGIHLLYTSFFLLLFLFKSSKFVREVIEKPWLMLVLFLGQHLFLCGLVSWLFFRVWKDV